MKSLSIVKNRKGLIGLALLMISVFIIIIASTVLFNSFFLFFRIGTGTESMSTDYENLSSGIYYGAWLANKGVTASGDLVINGVTTVHVSYDSTTHIITAGPVNNRTITCLYDDVITIWNYVL